ncbi:CCA tRNA nucleotidyltransferase [Bacillota bacterium Lsc_1132]
MIEPFLSAVPILKKLEDAGYESYFVGGSVRDYLLGKPINDVDIATSATPEEMKRIFPKTIDIGIAHGTLLVLFGGNEYELTTFRSESEYVDYRRPKEVSFIRSLQKDLERRDFTMNAIAMDRNGKILDPFDGQKAIKKRIIETVGKAEERFQEDALRIMRAIRFVSQLSFSIEAKTIAAVKDFAYLLKEIATERKRAEFEKLLTGGGRLQALQLLIDTNLFRYLPGLRDKPEALTKLIQYNCAHLNKNEMWVLIAYNAKLSGREVELFLRDWKLPIKQIREIQSILTFLTNRLERDWSAYALYCAKRETIRSVEKLFQTIRGIYEHDSLNQILSQYQQLPIKDRSELAVTGQDLMEWQGRPGGPWVSEMLLKIEQGVLVYEMINEKQAIKEWLLKCNQI